MQKYEEMSIEQRKARVDVDVALNQLNRAEKHAIQLGLNISIVYDAASGIWTTSDMVPLVSSRAAELARALFDEDQPKDVMPSTWGQASSGVREFYVTRAQRLLSKSRH